VSKARFRKRSRNKKATSTRSVMVEGFGLDQCGGEVGEVKRSRQSHLNKKLNSIKNSEIIAKSEFFYALCGTFL